MKQTIDAPNTVPTANIAVNKSRIKLYKNAGELPTYYLQKGQEFQIELFNPTKKCVLAKITLNGNLISQGGLVINPGQRVFLDRYLDVAKKFLFDTYDVSNTAEVKKAIEDNGDFKVEFYNEETPLPVLPSYPNYNPYYNPYWNGDYYYYPYRPYRPYRPYTYGTVWDGTVVCNTYTSNSNNSTLTSGLAANINAVNSFYSNSLDSSNLKATSFSDTLSYTDSLSEPEVKSSPLRQHSKKTIETGRVEQGSSSDQSFKYVNKEFSSWAFYTVEYKMLPISQKVNTLEDINVKRYCTSCGTKTKKTDKFCANCGTKA